MVRICPFGRKLAEPTAPQSYRAPGGAAAVHASAIIRGVSAAVAGGSSTLIGDVSAAIAGIVSVVARRVSAAVVTRAPDSLPGFAERLVCRPVLPPSRAPAGALWTCEFSRLGPDARLGAPSWPWPPERPALPSCSPCPLDSCRMLSPRQPRNRQGCQNQDRRAQNVAATGAQIHYNLQISSSSC